MLRMFIVQRISMTSYWFSQAFCVPEVQYCTLCLRILYVPHETQPKAHTHMPTFEVAVGLYRSRCCHKIVVVIY